MNVDMPLNKETRPNHIPVDFITKISLFLKYNNQLKHTIKKDEEKNCEILNISHAMPKENECMV